MSQAKVDRYKQEKAKRKETVKKEKMKNIFRRCVVGVVGLVLIAGIGYSAYGTYQSNKKKDSVEIDYTSLNDFSQKITEASQVAE